MYNVATCSQCSGTYLADRSTPSQSWPRCNTCTAAGPRPRFYSDAVYESNAEYNARIERENQAREEHYNRLSSGMF
jgi:hypothetical protein